MNLIIRLPLLASLLLLPPFLTAQENKKPTEDDYYRIVTLPLPEDCILEVGGLDWLDKEKTRLLACTRRGELWVIDNPYAKDPAMPGKKIKIKGDDGKEIEIDPKPEQIVTAKRMLFGLHEPLGLLVDPPKFPEGIYMAQRAELTRVRDTDGDDLIDDIETFCDGWEISGSYHEYAFGPKLGLDGNLWVTLNRPFGGGQEPEAYWRGWCVAVDPKGKMHPVCPGLRSPAGIGPDIHGNLYFTDNQGDHVAACKLGHLKPGVFHGNPAGIRTAKEHPLSNFTVPDKIDGQEYPLRGIPWSEAVEKNPHLQAPAVWFPYPELGKSHGEPIPDSTGGKFGPFAGQMFVGDQSSSLIVRTFLEEVEGEWQGACFMFREGFQCGVLRLAWGNDGSLFVGQTGRGWGSRGGRPHGLQRLDWTGKVPFEIHEMRAEPDGFTLTFTKPADPKTLSDVKSYSGQNWMYHYHSGYGDKPRDMTDLKISKAEAASDGMSVRLRIDGLKPYYIHEVRAEGLRSADGLPLLHPAGYYTLNRIPKG